MKAFENSSRRQKRSNVKVCLFVSRRDCSIIAVVFFLMFALYIYHMINILESYRRDDIIFVSSTISSFLPVTTAPKKNISPFDDKTAVIPIYFVNLDSSKDRRKEFENEFSLLPKESNLSLHRVSGVSIDDVKQMLNEKQLLLNDFVIQK